MLLNWLVVVDITSFGLKKVTALGHSEGMT